jgi:hypothetical protein
MSGLKIVVWSVAIGFAGVLPLLLYMALGPADGNPIGLGLLAVVAVPVGVVGVMVGLIVMLVQKFVRRGE